MNIRRLAADQFEIRLSKIDLGTIGNCLNEACNGIRISEFQTRVGVPREEAQKLLDEIISAYRAPSD